MTGAQLAADLHSAIDEGIRLFEGVDDSCTLRRLRPDGWSVREILGHLIDSACNNHRRFIIGQSPSTTAFDGYAQNDWVARNHYDRVPSRDLVALWTAYNRHLAHVIATTPDEAAARTALAPDGSAPVTIRFLMEDYVRHLRHHLGQIRTLLAA